MPEGAVRIGRRAGASLIDEAADLVTRCVEEEHPGTPDPPAWARVLHSGQCHPRQAGGIRYDERQVPGRVHDVETFDRQHRGLLCLEAAEEKGGKSEGQDYVANEVPLGERVTVHGTPLRARQSGIHFDGEQECGVARTYTFIVTAIC